eukprot:TRINITY_DN9061_c0_g1_i1.p1 TRINITY_DN9061_c0_g1~~TRINITY_DN9061_c0_g1_i1.p1  ORF type:complete len:384 (-),score=57.80 TRINITY_DN9061_c0_g1_i1:145-1296(-)
MDDVVVEFLVGDLVDHLATYLDPTTLFQFRLTCKRWHEAFVKCLTFRKRSLLDAVASNKLKWEHVGEAPEDLKTTVGHTVNPLEPLSFLVFGGEAAGNSREYYNDLVSYSPFTNTWTTFKTHNTVTSPSPRGFASLHTLLINGEWHVLIFGGQSRSGEEGTWSFYSDIWVLNLEKPFDAEKKLYRWEELKPRNSRVIEARVGHRSCIFGEELWVFGGCFVKDDVYTHFNDVWTFHLRHHTWTKIEVTGEVPSVRHSPALSVLDNHRFSIASGSVVGGADCNDIWIFDTTTRTFQKTPATVTHSSEWFSMDSFALTPDSLILLSAFPEVCNLKTGERKDLFSFTATRGFAHRNFFKGFDFCILWEKRKMTILKNLAPWEPTAYL